MTKLSVAGKNLAVANTYQGLKKVVAKAQGATLQRCLVHFVRRRPSIVDPETALDGGRGHRHRLRPGECPGFV